MKKFIKKHLSSTCLIFFLLFSFSIFLFPTTIYAYSCSCLVSNERAAPQRTTLDCPDTSCSQGRCAERGINCEPISGEAEETAPNEGPTDWQGNPVKPNLQVKIGSTAVNLETITCDPGKDCEIPWIGKYVSALYQYGVGIALIIATVMIMAGGLFWLMSAGSPDKVGKAKTFITSALSGMMIALFSFLILYTVNPRLVNLSPLIIPAIEKQDILITTVETGRDVPGRSTGGATKSSPSNIAGEQTARDEFDALGVGTWESEAGATNVRDLPELSQTYLAEVAGGMRGSENNEVLLLTGGAETRGHHRHGPENNTFDINGSNSNWNNHVSSNLSASETLSWGQASYMDNQTIDGTCCHTVMSVNEGNHYHVEIHDAGWRDPGGKLR